MERDMFEEEWQNLLPHLEEEFRSNEMIAVNERQYVDSVRWLVATSLQRVFWICQNCRHIETIDYCADTVEQIWQGRPLQSVRVYRTVDGVRHTRLNDNGRNCSQCGYRCWKQKELKSSIVKESHRCDARCEMATSEKCECSCAGANHGIAHKAR